MRDAWLDFFDNKVVVVTGGTGLIGRQVVSLLLNETGVKRVIVLTMDSPLPDTYEPGRRVMYIHDIRNFDDNIMMLKIVRPDIVIHLAGIKASPKISIEQAFTHVNQMLLMNSSLIQACRIVDVPSLLYTSSVGVYSPTQGTILESHYDMASVPMDPAGWAKRMGEYVISLHRKETGRKWSVVRLTNTYGPGDNFDPDTAMFVGAMMAKFQRARQTGRPAEFWGNGEEIRDFLFSRDAAIGILQACAASPDEPINLGGGKEYRIKDLVKAMHKITQTEYTWLGGEAQYPRRVLSIEKARELIGYDPSTPLIESLQETWEWFLTNDESQTRVDYFKKR